MKEPEVPKTDCQGCKARDEMIAGLSARVDELERSVACAVPTAPKSWDAEYRFSAEWTKELKRQS